MPSTSTTPEALMYGIIAVRDEVDYLASRLNPDGARVFDPVSLPMPKFVPSELGFLRAISWLYVLLIEAGHVNVRFLCSLSVGYGLDAEGRTSAHLEMVHHMRTWLQHNVDFTKERNRLIVEKCEAWFRSTCNTVAPSSEEEWYACVVALLQQGTGVLRVMSKCLRRVERDEARDEICRNWETRRKRHHPPHQFDELISRVSTDLGRDALDPVRLRKRYFERWTQALDQLQGDYEFEVEGRKLVEHALLSDESAVLPITGKDIIQELGVAPGPLVGALLGKAAQMYREAPCNRSDMLERLRAELPAGPG